MASGIRDESVALLALLRLRPGKRTWSEITAETLRSGSAAIALDVLTDDGSLVRPSLAPELDQAESEVEAWRRAGIEFVTVLDEGYPSQLRDIHQAPPFLFYKGDLRASDRGVSVVGSRKASDAGLAAARGAAATLVRRGLTVVSGLAAGVDAAAHSEALHRGGRTVAVVGTGINRVYPAQNKKLAADIEAHGGLVLSQFFPDAPPTRITFPMRNATMSGYGKATFIAEASETSGSRIQARVAVEHGRPVILNRSVVESTEWGKAMAGGPSVYVVDSVADLERALDRIEELEEGLRSDLVPTASLA